MNTEARNGCSCPRSLWLHRELTQLSSSFYYKPSEKTLTLVTGRASGAAAEGQQVCATHDGVIFHSSLTASPTDQRGAEAGSAPATHSGPRCRRQSRNAACAQASLQAPACRSFLGTVLSEAKVSPTEGTLEPPAHSPSDFLHEPLPLPQPRLLWASASRPEHHITSRHGSRWA